MEFARPVGAQINILPREPELEQQEEEIINDGAEAKQLPGPDAASVVALQAVDEGKVAHPAAVVAAGVEAVKLLLAHSPSDAVIDALGALRDIVPRVHLLDLVMEAVGADLAGAHGRDGLARRQDQVVLLRLGKRRHVRGEHLWDAADLGADDVEPAAGGLDDDGAKGLGERRV